MADLFDNPMGLMGFEFVEFASPDARHARAAVREARLHAGGAATARRTCCCTARATSTSSSTASRKSLAALLRGRARARRPAGWRFACSDSHQAYERALELGAQPIEMPDRADGAAPAGDQGHRRRAALPDRPLRGRQVDLRHRLRVHRRRRPASARARPEDRRPPDAQRLPRPHGVLGRASTRSCSTSARSATSTSRANTPA